VSRLYVYCEGQTEETFVRELLAPHLEPLGLFAKAILASTKRSKSGLKFKGGIVSHLRIKRELQNLLQDGDVAAVTTMIDLYGLPDDFPGRHTKPPGGPRIAVAHLERQFELDVGNGRFIPHLSLHEFEALMFVSPLAISAVVEGVDRSQGGEKLASTASAYACPEDIDDGPTTAPSKRILEALPSYRKVLHGPIVAKRIGLQALREACPHFDGWVRTLEALGK
jgi:Domain of unknown function (DUF4276)